MKKILLFAATLTMAFYVGAQEQESIIFTAAETFNTDKTIGSITFKPGGKDYVVDANKAYFYDGDLANATLDNSTTYDFRLKLGGKSNVDKGERLIVLNANKAGVLKLAVRTGKNDDITRTMIVLQGGKEIFNKVIKEDDAKVVPNPTEEKPDATTNIYPYQTIEVEAGEVTITAPINSLNFYAFIWTPEGAGNSISDANTDKGAVVSSVAYDLTGRKVSSETKGIIVKRLTYENGSVETVKELVK